MTPQQVQIWKFLLMLVIHVYQYLEFIFIAIRATIFATHVETSLLMDCSHMSPANPTHHAFSFANWAYTAQVGFLGGMVILFVFSTSSRVSKNLPQWH